VCVCVCVCVQHRCTFNNDRHLTYTHTYTPYVQGQYNVSVCFAGREIPKSPFMVTFEPNASNVTAEGPGVDEAGLLQLGQATSFRVDSSSE